MDCPDIETLQNQVSALSEELELFTYAASHDLQTPLRGISGLLGILHRQLDGQLDERQQCLFAQIFNDCRYATDLINNILSYSRLGREPMQHESIDLWTLALEICDRHHATIEERKAVLTFSSLPEVWGDRHQIGRALENLIGNALKYCKTTPLIVISGSESRTRWAIAVQDNGIGVDPELQGQLFTMFRRLHSRSEFDGTGVGLATVSKIAQNHGGNAWVESAGIGTGCTFHFTIKKPY
jgi:light-regulated signal transduction histidine kinase (bacteriophytochrome)